MAFLQHAEVFVDTPYDTCDGGLASTRRAVEHEVIGYLCRLQPLGLALLLELHEVSQ